MDRQPDGDLLGISPVNAMAAVWGDVEAVAGAQVAGLGFVGKAQASRALQQHDPFALRLVVPEIRRAGLAGRNDALDGEAWPLKEF